MTFSERLEHYQHLINDDITAYSEGILAETDQQYGAYSREVLEPYIDVLSRGGKRLRGALVMASYEMFGGTDQTVALRGARAIEMVNAYLLIVDDIADRSVTRRGGPAAHVLMQRYHEERSLKGDAHHFGESMAAHSAMLGGYLAEMTFDDLDIPAETKLTLLRSLHSNLIHTFHGQLRDILNETLAENYERDALWVAEHKTAYYTVINPLEIGAILGGANDTDLAYLRRYGLPAGLAFQIADDILGIYGVDAETGKSSLDDLKEGKITVLITHALEHATAAQKQQLQTMMGNADLTHHDLDTCKAIMAETGTYDYVSTKARNLSSQALAELEKFPHGWNAELIDFLRQLTNSFVERKK